MNLQVNRFPEKIKLKSNLAQSQALLARSVVDSDMVLTLTSRETVLSRASRRDKYPTCLLVFESAPKRLVLFSETDNEVVKKIDLPGNIMSAAFHEEFPSNGQIVVQYVEEDEPTHVSICVIKYDREKKSARRYANNPISRDKVGCGVDKNQSTVNLSSVEAVCMSELVSGSDELSVKDWTTFKKPHIILTRQITFFTQYMLSTTAGKNSEGTTGRDSCYQQNIQFFDYVTALKSTQVLAFREIALPTRYRRGGCIISSSDVVGVNAKLVIGSARRVIDTTVNERSIAMLVADYNDSKKYGFFPFRKGTVRYSDSSISKSMMLFELDIETTHLASTDTKLFAASQRTVTVYDRFQHDYTTALTDNVGCVPEEQRKLSIPYFDKMLHIDPDFHNLSSLRSTYEYAQRVYCGNLDILNTVKLSSPSCLYQFPENETITHLKTAGYGDIELLLVVTSSESTSNRHNSGIAPDKTYVFLNGVEVFRKTFNAPIEKAKLYPVHAASDVVDPDQCFRNNRLVAFCLELHLVGNVCLSFDVYPDNSSVVVRDLDREQIQTRNVSAVPQMSRFIDF
jgi:hypothetical protein